MENKTFSQYETILYVEAYENFTKAPAELRPSLIPKFLEKLTALGIKADESQIKIRINAIHKWHQLNSRSLLNDEQFAKFKIDAETAEICKLHTDNIDAFNSLKERVTPVPVPVTQITVPAPTAAVSVPTAQVLPAAQKYERKNGSDRGMFSWWLQGVKDVFNPAARRFRRMEYWSFITGNYIIANVLIALAVVIISASGSVVSLMKNVFAIYIISLVISLPVCAAQVVALKKRMNDTFKDYALWEKKPFLTGVFAFKGSLIVFAASFVVGLLPSVIRERGFLLFLAAVLGICSTVFSIAMLVYSFRDSTPAENRYGENPKKNYVKQTKFWQIIVAYVVMIIAWIVLIIAVFSTLVDAWAGRGLADDDSVNIPLRNYTVVTEHERLSDDRYTTLVSIIISYLLRLSPRAVLTSMSAGIIPRSSSTTLKLDLKSISVSVICNMTVPPFLIIIIPPKT